jgi:hypothetical protein
LNNNAVDSTAIPPFESIIDTALEVPWPSQYLFSDSSASSDIPGSIAGVSPESVPYCIIYILTTVYPPCYISSMTLLAYYSAF